MEANGTILVGIIAYDAEDASHELSTYGFVIFIDAVLFDK